MTDRPRLTVVGKGEPVADAKSEDVTHAEEAAALLVEAVKGGHGFWLLIDSDEPVATYSGDLLTLCATAEEVAKDLKRQALGFFD
jgi:hypothetical protein